MGKIENLFHAKLESICEDFRNEITSLPLWKLDSFLPKEIKIRTLDEKIEYLMENFKAKNPIYLLIDNDLKLLKDNKHLSLDEFKSLNVDPRYLESLGFNKKQIDIYYEFVSKVKT
ncbi:hypothetical protein ABF190_001392 [Flavobacterium psychrophilum]|uniref:hypothetical protein n=1 Tax=Flavobacterium psychrophilum TaxID=96345 RepID=UPI000B7C34AA|nr:hypothetical protein [Flavobacterium psychrophilum]SNB12240.1 hypothetical protein FPC831_800008 [Flavobacterium psychrophilum]